ncbi:MAG: PolC-type DNA polymerase III [Clostridia bacterium]
MRTAPPAGDTPPKAAAQAKIVALGDSLGIPVVATCDAHFFNERDSIYRKIMMNGQKYEDSEHQPPLFMRTTREMLDEFAYLGPEKAHEVVVENSRAIAGLIEKLSPIPEGSHPPVISGSDTELRRICGDRVRQIYGDVLPDIVKERMEREMDSIISNRFSVMYIIAQKLTAKSIAEGYLVGSRGSVGSSFVAYLAGITEINPLEAHYICPGCKSFIFVPGMDCGIDLPDKDCQQCGTRMDKAGYDIPFETFLGFEGDKQPDIDLNFSGEYQTMAHRHVEELFGTSNVFKAGTISTIKEKTAFGFVKGYAEDKNLNLPNAEINRLVRGISGVRKTTGQHPGGMIVLPSEHSIYEFTPVQRPADDEGSPVVTTHFDFHSLHDTLLKLDLLGHDDPTVLKMLGVMTGMDPAKVDIADDKVLQLFKNTESLELQKVIPTSLGVLGIPEFGTKFARELLQGTHPTTFSDLVKISGLSHGTDVWLNNAKDLIDKGTATLKNIICTRDEIMNTLIGKGMDKKTAFDITERVRRGKGLTESQETAMKEQGIPGWYIKSCKTIKYMYPKAHAAAYVLMALRIAWFKVYHPKEFYASYFSIRADDFDLEIMNREYDVLMNALRDMDVRYKELSDKEKNIYTILEVAIEMKARGIVFLGIDLYRSHAVHHLVEEEGIRLPFSAMTGIGKAAANRISEEGKIRPFSSVEDFKNRTGVTKTVVEKLKDYGVLMHLPDSSQLSFFS